jgi:BMFP domain-containing protein YqiC
MKVNKNIMEDETNKIIKEQFDRLPKKIQDAIVKSDWEKEVRKIAQKYRLRVDQGNFLENEIFLFMLGLESLEDLVSELQEELGGEGVDVFAILGEVEDGIISKIRSIVQENTKNTYLKDGVKNAAQPDEILTVTREEILKDIEDESLDDTRDKADALEKELPKLENKNVMPSSEEIPSTKSQIPNKSEISNPKSQTELVQKEEEIPANLPSEKSSEPIDPVEAGLNNTVSTSNKGYKEKDPYREPIE